MWKRIPISGGADAETVGLVPDGNRGIVAVAGDRLLVGDVDGLRTVPLVEGDKPIEIKGCTRARVGPVFLMAGSGALYEWDGRTARLHAAFREMGQVYAIRQAGPAAVWVVAEGGLWCWEGTRWRRRLAGYDVVAHSVFELADESALAYIENPLSLRGLWEWQGESRPRPLRHVVQTTIASIAIGPAGETVVVHRCR